MKTWNIRMDVDFIPKWWSLRVFICAGVVGEKIGLFYGFMVLPKAAYIALHTLLAS